MPSPNTSERRPSLLWRPEFPFRPSSLPFYYGWVVLAISTIGLVMSAPGQTIGVSVFTEALLETTGLSRVQFSNAYLMGTLASGLLLPYAGSQLDRIGVRRFVVAASIGLAIVLALLSQVDRLADEVAKLGLSRITAAYALLIIGFLGLRFTGQGALTLVSRTILGRWFDKKRGLVSSISAPFASVSFASSPLLLAGWVAHSGWRDAWQEMALVIGLGMGFFGWLFFRESPEECDLPMDGIAASPAPLSIVLEERVEPKSASTPRAATPLANAADPHDYTRKEAIRTAAFWLVTLAMSNHALVGTGIALHIVDLAAESGLSEAEALRLFLPVTLISVPTGIIMGLAVDRFPMRRLIMAMMVGQTLMFGLAPHLGNPVLYVLCLAGWGFSGGFYGPLTVAALPNFFGRTHLGAIQGVMMMVLVIASALGPALLALAKSSFGSYETGLHLLALLPSVLFFVALFMPDPKSRR